MSESRKRPARLVLDDPAQVRALTGALPNRIVAAYERLGQATVAEIAAAIDEPAESLYYHVRRLARVGILRASEHRPTSGPVETVWMLPAQEIAIDPDNRRPAYLAAVVRSVRSLLRLAERDASAALESPATVRRGSGRSLMVQQHFARLSKRDLDELNRRLEDIAEFVHERGTCARGTAVSLTMVLSPSSAERAE